MITKSTDSGLSRKINQSLKMRKGISFIIILTVLLFPFAFLSSPVSLLAYVAPKNLYTKATLSTFNCQPDSDGIYLFHTIYKSFYDPSIVNTPEKLNHLSFYGGSGTWLGNDVSELSSIYLFDQDVTGFSQVMSYSDEEEYFVYSVVTCLPVHAGDNFTVAFNYNSSYVNSQDRYKYMSFIPGGTGIRIAHKVNGNSHLNEPLTYTTQSSNQHLAVFLDSDGYTSSGNGFYSGSSYSSHCLKEFSNLSFIGSLCRFTDVFTTPYGLSSGSEISVTMEDNVDNYSFSVYEIFTDGTTNPGLDSGEPVTTVPPPVTTVSGTSGSSSGSGTDLSEISSYLRDILQAVLDKTVEVTVNVSSAVHEKLDAILTTLRELPSNMWECFKIGLADMFDIDISDEPEQPPEESDDSSGKDEDISLEIDQDSFNSAVESADIDKLDTSIGGDNGAIAFFWYFTNRFMNVMNLYAVVPLILLLSFLTWLIKG